MICKWSGADYRRAGGQRRLVLDRMWWGGIVPGQESDEDRYGKEVMTVEDLKVGSFGQQTPRMQATIIVIIVLLFPPAVLLQCSLNQRILVIERATGRDVSYIQVQQDYCTVKFEDSETLQYLRNCPCPESRTSLLPLPSPVDPLPPVSPVYPLALPAPSSPIPSVLKELPSLPSPKSESDLSVVLSQDAGNNLSNEIISLISLVGLGLMGALVAALRKLCWSGLLSLQRKFGLTGPASNGINLIDV